MVRRYIDGRQLQKLRKQVGLSEQELSHLLRIPNAMLLDIERNHRETINDLSFHLVQSWGRTCRSNFTPNLFPGWQSHLKKLLGITE